MNGQPRPQEVQHDLAGTIPAELAVVLQAYGGAVDCAYLFGSAARGDTGPLSDLDIGLLLAESVGSEASADIAAAVAGQLQKLAGPTVDVTILNDSPPALQHRVIRDGQPVFVGNARGRVRFETGVLREFLDFKPVLERYDQALLARAREGRLGG